MDDKAKKLVVQKLNKELGRSYKNLEKVADLHRQISIEKSSIENKVRIFCALYSKVFINVVAPAKTT